jgi:hypothetical protein
MPKADAIRTERAIVLQVLISRITDDCRPEYLAHEQAVPYRPAFPRVEHGTVRASETWRRGDYVLAQHLARRLGHVAGDLMASKYPTSVRHSRRPTKP